ncbi:phospholipase/carboxylesterase [Hypomontagnella submonticulosa]|nr:phospholipase/carboxylesterase [Hypomontagnella submonticulosa]
MDYTHIFDKSRIPFVVEPTSKHTHTFILLHGLGSNGKKFGQELLGTGVSSDGRKLTEIFPGARFVFPTAARGLSTAFRRTRLNQWFDFASLDNPCYNTGIQRDGLESSSAEIQDLIKMEAKYVSYRKMILGGLSHGCAMALSLLLALEFPLGGFIGMSGWLPFEPDIQKLVKPTNNDEAGDITNPFGPDDDVSYLSDADDEKEDSDEEVEEDELLQDVFFFCREQAFGYSDEEPVELSHTSIATPIFLGHGNNDEKINPSFGRTASTTLSTIGYDVTWKSYKDQGHWYKIPDEIDDIVEFVKHKVGWGKKGS